MIKGGACSLPACAYAAAAETCASWAPATAAGPAGAARGAVARRISRGRARQALRGPRRAMRVPRPAGSAPPGSRAGTHGKATAGKTPANYHLLSTALFEKKLTYGRIRKVVDLPICDAWGANGASPVSPGLSCARCGAPPGTTWDKHNTVSH